MDTDTNRRDEKHSAGVCADGCRAPHEKWRTKDHRTAYEPHQRIRTTPCGRFIHFVPLVGQLTGAGIDRTNVLAQVACAALERSGQAPQMCIQDHGRFTAVVPVADVESCVGIIERALAGEPERAAVERYRTAGHLASLMASLSRTTGTTPILPLDCPADLGPA